METMTFWEECAAQASQDRRAQSRLTLAVPIQIGGTSSSGELFWEETETLNVSQSGCQFTLRNLEMTPGAVVAIRIKPRKSIAAPSRAAFFQVQWCKPAADGRFAIGAMQLHQQDIWDLVFPDAQKQAVPAT